MATTPDPIKDSSRCKSCGQVISSDCVMWAGPAVPGVCKGASLTEVVTQVSANGSASDCCKGVFPPGSSSAYTGSWVDFSAGMPASGSWASGSYNIANVGYGGNMYNPQYKWTSDGDLLVRGGFQLNITRLTTTPTGFIIPLVTLNPANFPAGAAGGNFQKILTTVFVNAPNNSVSVLGYCYLILDKTTGLLSLETSFCDIGLGLFSVNPVNLTVRFNLA